MQSIINELTPWFKQRHKWVQDAAKRILIKGSLSVSDISELVQLCKKEVGIPITPDIIAAQVDKTDFNIKDTAITVRLKSIGEIEGINALCPKNPLVFGEGNITIIYGLNGTGKSGYVRIIKSVSGAKNAQPLLGDVFSSAKKTQRCRLLCVVAGKEQNFDWTPSDGTIMELEPIEVYDSSCIQSYIDKENEISYEPSLLQFLTKLINACDQVSQSITIEINANPTKKPTLPPEYINTDLGRWYNQLSPSTADIEIDTKTSWNDQKGMKFQEIGNRISENNPTEKAKNLERNIEHLQTLKKLLEHLQIKYSDVAYTSYIQMIEDAQLKSNVAAEHAAKVFGNTALEGVGSETWKAMWEKARTYSLEVVYRNETFPNTEKDARCVLCQQLLDSSAKERLISFETYVKGKLESDAKTAEDLATSARFAIESYPDIDQFVVELDACNISGDDNRLKMLDFYDKIKKRKDSFLLGHELGFLPVMPSGDAITWIGQRISQIEIEVKKYKEDAKTENRPLLEKELRELGANKWLFEQRSSIYSELNRLKNISKLEQSKSTTNTAVLSAKKASLSAQIITGSYITRFQHELERLGAKHIAVSLEQTKTTKGRVFHQVKLKNFSNPAYASQVLSEGEARVVSLAAFHADASGQVSKSTFIFDDPISSLDQNYEEATAARLVEVSSNRQVIVFTHRLSFLVLLREKAGDNAPHIVMLRNEEWGKGEPGDASSYIDNPSVSINRILTKLLPEAKKVINTEGRAKYDLIARGICNDIRITIERLIEYDLTNNVIHRFRRNIITKDKLQKLSVITLADCNFIDAYMTKYSAYVHSQPTEIAVQLPNPGEIEADLIALKVWHTEFSKREPKISGA